MSIIRVVVNRIKKGLLSLLAPLILIASLALLSFATVEGSFILIVIGAVVLMLTVCYCIGYIEER